MNRCGVNATWNGLSMVLTSPREYGLQQRSFPGNLPGMKTLTVDDYQRIRLPDARPRSKFSYEPDADGTIRLIPVKADTKEAFPPGSLAKYFTAERNKEELAILKGCVQGPV